ncbi:MAG: helix-turn-helix transcriptional regulator, partial [Chloroflexota bacterium]|nr:helix-turn-helix transcriptional regulator [Chloroflexota bacterium]
MTAGPAAAPPLLETKLYLPRRRSELVARPRLLNRLHKGTAARLVLVSAPPGFGKTTLLAEWLTNDDRHTGWVSLDERDNEPATFWSYVLTALGTERSKGAAIQLRTADSPIEPILITLINDIAESGVPRALVLDDYHVITNPEIHSAVTFLLENLPAPMQLVISSRADPSLPLARLRVRGELVEIRAADLRFTPDEAAAFLRDVMGLELSAETIAALEQRTEGWIAGLQLAALSMHGRDDVSGFVSAFTGDARYIVDYLLEEVLQRQPDDLRDFLLQTSILERLSGPLCDAVTGRSDSSRTLAHLEAANLFVIPLDDRRQWYRYHHLFA